MKYITIETEKELSIRRPTNGCAMFVSMALEDFQIDMLLDNIGLFDIQRWANKHDYEVKLKQMQP